MAFSVPGYEIGELLGYGSHGEVWAGRSRRDGSRVALKKVPLVSMQSVNGAAAEAALLAALDHPSLIKFHELVHSGDFMVLVLELATGGSLSQVLQRRGCLTPGEVGVSLSEVGSALQHAHEEGVVHGDVSAANLLYTAEGRLKLADLGLARVVGADSALLGTPAYIDPVVAAGGAAGAASDVFSLAAIALHALTGAGPWVPESLANSENDSSLSVESVLAIAATGRIEGLPERLAGAPPAMAAALLRALDPEPYRRGSAAELALDLRASAEPVPVVLRAGKVLPNMGRHSAQPHGVQGGEAHPDEVRAGEGQPHDTRAGEGQPHDMHAGRAHPDGTYRGDFSHPRGTSEHGDDEPIATLYRPDFQRPAAAELTHVARPQVRALAMPEPTRAQRMLRAVRSRRALVTASALITATLLGGWMIAGPGVDRAAALFGRASAAAATGPSRGGPSQLTPTATTPRSSRQPPATQAAATQLPANQARAAQLPAAQAAATQLPAEQLPGAQLPAAQAAATQLPAAQLPANPASASQLPASQAPALAAPATPPHAAPVPPTPAPGAPIDLAPARSGSVSSETVTQPEDAVRILSELDANRSSAYALRRPDLLERVYSSASLRREDAAQLIATVPLGCGLFDLSTRYTAITVRTTAAQVAINAQVTSVGGVLRCNGQTRASVAIRPAQQMAITLVRDGAGSYLIGSQNQTGPDAK